MPEPIFTNCGFFLKLKKITIQEKNKLKDCIKENGGQITFSINDKCTHVVTDDADALSSVHLKTIKKQQLPIVGVNFIWDSVKENRLLSPFDSEPLKTLESTPVDVKIVSVCEHDGQKVKDWAKASLSSYDSERESDESSNPDELRWFSNDDKNIPYFPEDFEVAKYDVLEKVTAHGEYVVVELQCALQRCDYPFRIHSHYRVLDGVEDQKRCAATKTSEEARRAYELCTEELKKADFQIRHDFPREAEHLASTKLQEMLIAEAISCSTLSEEVGVFVELIWAEALGLLNHLLLRPVTSISLNDVSKAEGVLLRAKKALDEGKSPGELTEVIAEFYKIIPHKSGINYNICKKLLSNKQDLCQLIRDMLNVNEINMSSPNPPSLSKYRALRCKIDALDANSEEFNDVKQQVVQNNFRGLLLPKMVVEEHGIERTDSGNLGCGLYFSNSISTSIKYSQPNKIDGTRLLVICDVALGTCLDTSQKDLSLTKAPSGYNSVHGIRKTKDNDSAFQDDEFVVYRMSQIKMKYVVKFCLADDKVKEFHPTIQAKLEDQAPVPEHQSQPEDYEIPSENMLDDIASGLLDRYGNPIPLKDVCIKGRILDFTAQVVVFQTYENTSDSPIEAKYVFPLDDTAAVCGFEAFIKGKHIIGEVKEKETAHRQYREAVIRGHGAYLMDQDAPDIFTVSVGNLPPSTRVLIKITYITELTYSFDKCSFHLPAAVAPWQQDKALNENTQDTVTKVAVKRIGTKAGGFSLEMSVEMPFEIDDIYCWTHQLKIKKTACKAVIRTVEDSSLDVSGFAMEIMMGNVHLPRMWVEKHPDKETEACMLVFQPEFATPIDPSVYRGEAIICLDCSNSMAGSEMQQAKQIALCALELCCFAKRLSVIKFGTNFVHFPFNPEKCVMDLTALKEFVSSATPSMGNSDLWKTLHYLSLLYPSKSKRNVLLISDGHVQNEAMTLQIVKQNASHTRIFTCGVGSAANRHMLRSLSQYGAGAFEYFDVKSKYNWQRKIECQITRMTSLGCSAVSIKWQQFDTNAPELTYAPAQIQSLFNNEHIVIYGFISHCTQATLNALIDNKELKTMVSTTELQKTTGTMLHKLAARAFIRDYEQGILDENEAGHEMKKQQLKSLIIKLSLENSILTQFTSFVAIERRDVNEDQDADTLNISELIAKEDVDILPYMQYQADVYPDDADVYEDEDTDTLNISELIAKEDLDILPYMQSQADVYPDSVVETSYNLSGQKVSKGDSLSLNLKEPCLELASLSAAPIPSLSFGQSFSSLSTIPTTTTTFGFGSAASQGPKARMQGIIAGRGPTTPFQVHSRLSPSKQIASPPSGTGIFGSSFNLGDFHDVCEQGIFLQSGGLPVPKETSVSAPPFLSAQLPTKASAPALAPLVFGSCMERVNMKDSPPLPVQDQHSLPFGSQLQFQKYHQLSSHAPLVAAQSVVQHAPGSGIPEAADYHMPLPEDEWPLPSRASLFRKKSSGLEVACSRQRPGGLFGKPSEETPQDFIGKMMKAKKKVFRKPAVQKTLSAVSWPELSKLQNQDGYWQLTPELGALLDLDVDDLVNISLTKRGIQSLGPKGKEKLLQLIATLLVLQVVRFKQLEGITFKSLMKLNDSPPSGAFDAVKKAVEWAKRTHRQFPDICQRLELGKDWDSATKKLLSIETSTPPCQQ